MENKDGPAELWLNGFCIGRTRSTVFEEDTQFIKVGDVQYSSRLARRVKLKMSDGDLDVEALARALKAEPAELNQGHFLPCPESDIILAQVVEVE